MEVEFKTTEIFVEAPSGNLAPLALV